MNRIIVALLASLVSVPVLGEPPTFPDAAASDPATMGWMRGAPPPPESVVPYADMQDLFVGTECVAGV